MFMDCPSAHSKLNASISIPARNPANSLSYSRRSCGVLGELLASRKASAALISVTEKNLAIAMVMNTYSPMLGIRVSRIPANVLRMLLGKWVSVEASLERIPLFCVEKPGCQSKMLAETGDQPNQVQGVHFSHS